MADTLVELLTAEGLKRYKLEKAENILRLEAEHRFGNYKLPSDSPYEFVNGALKRVNRARTAEKSEKSVGKS